MEFLNARRAKTEAQQQDSCSMQPREGDERELSSFGSRKEEERKKRKERRKKKERKEGMGSVGPKEKKEKKMGGNWAWPNRLFQAGN
ncbi:MAG: hypothetical protein Q8807_03015 ['Waltheria sp.' little leaf phytoplasma]|nr:hypothetical protein ['Waltheria sp.' little leaf phytoplasma]